jgi:hypothetical protein
MTGLLCHLWDIQNNTRKGDVKHMMGHIPPMPYMVHLDYSRMAGFKVGINIAQYRGLRNKKRVGRLPKCWSVRNGKRVAVRTTVSETK